MHSNAGSAQLEQLGYLRLSTTDFSGPFSKELVLYLQ